MPISKQKIVLGIDPGYAITGYGVIQSFKGNFNLIKFGVIASSPQEPFGKRLEKINTKLTELIKKYQPDEIAIEKIFFTKNVKTALQVGEARGVAVLTVQQNKKTLREFTPLQIKQALTGYGLAPKIQIQKVVQQILRLKKLPKPDDAADALAIAICCAQTKIF